MAISVNELMMDTDWGVPVGLDAGAADDAAVTAVVVDWGSLPGVLLGLPIRARRVVMMSVIIAKRVGLEPEPAGTSDYKIQSGKHSLITTFVTHRIPAPKRIAYALR